MRELNTTELASVAGGTWGCFSWSWSWCKPATPSTKPASTCTKPTSTCTTKTSTCGTPAPTPEIN